MKTVSERLKDMIVQKALDQLTERSEQERRQRELAAAVKQLEELANELNTVGVQLRGYYSRQKLVVSVQDGRMWVNPGDERGINIEPKIGDSGAVIFNVRGAKAPYHSFEDVTEYLLKWIVDRAVVDA